MTDGNVRCDGLAPTRLNLASQQLELGVAFREPGRGDGSALVQGGFFQNYVGIVIATAYSASSQSGEEVKRAEVRDSVFEPLDVPADSANPPAAISMNYRMARDDPDPRDPIAVYNFNAKPGDDFKVYYSLAGPQSEAPCPNTRPDIGGWICGGR